MPRGMPASAVRRRRSTLALVAGLALIGAATSACTAPVDSPSAPASAPVAIPSPTASDATAPQLVPDGTAADNLPLFAQVTTRVWASDRRAEGRAYVDALVAAGFDRERMQVTADLTTVGNPVESLQFSVAWGDEECLIGQIGPSTGEPVTTVMPQLVQGRCLVGQTRSIDW